MSRLKKHLEELRREPSTWSPQHDRLMTEIGFSKTELGILSKLALFPESLVTREQLLGVMRGKAPHTIDSHIMSIRRKLERQKSSMSIETVKGSGFILRRGLPTD